MLPLQRVLCPTDFSEPSYVALQAAVELAQHFSAELLLLHVATPIPVLPSKLAPTGFNSEQYQKELQDSGLAQLRGLSDRIPAGLRLRPLVCSGEAADEIVAVAEREQVDLIVIATHGLTGWRRFIAGSVTERVMRLTPCPMLAIRCPQDGGLVADSALS